MFCDIQTRGGENTIDLKPGLSFHINTIIIFVGPLIYLAQRVA